MRLFPCVLIATFLLLSPPSRAQTPSPDGEALSVDNAIQTLDQEFQKLPAWRQGGVEVGATAKPLDDPSFSWIAGYIWDHPMAGHPKPWPQPSHDFPAWTSNGAAEASPNGDMIATMDKNLVPLTWSGTLNFTVRKMPADLAATVDTTDPKDYIGATINSFPYAQKYGVFAISAKLPGGKGIWPAFWLLPADKSWPPEIDVMEVLGKDPGTLYTTVHTNVPKKETAIGHATDTHLDLGAAFHEYAVDWGPEQIKWYFDRQLVFSQPTPPDLHKPCYIIANVAVGGPKNWGGAPDTTTKFPATMQVSYIKAWQRKEYMEQANEGANPQNTHD